MNAPPSEPKCARCGHDKNEHEGGDYGDRWVGMVPTPPYCLGAVSCYCPAFISMSPKRDG